MFELPANKIGLIAALFIFTLLDGSASPDGTVSGSQVWTLDNDTTATLEPQADGTARLTPLSAGTLGTVTVNYSAEGINADGVTVPLTGSETYNVVAPAVVIPDTVTVPLTTTIEGA